MAEEVVQSPNLEPTTAGPDFSENELFPVDIYNLFFSFNHLLDEVWHPPISRNHLLTFPSPKNQLKWISSTNFARQRHPLPRENLNEYPYPNN